MSSTWQERAADKRNRIDHSIPAEWKITTLPNESWVIDFPEKSGLLSEKELLITKTPATHLVAKLANGELKSVEITLAFAKRAALAHQLVGCNTLICLELWKSM